MKNKYKKHDPAENRIILLKIGQCLVEQLSNTNSQLMKKKLRKLVQEEEKSATVILGDFIDDIIGEVKKSALEKNNKLKNWIFLDIELLMKLIKMDNGIPFHLQISLEDFRSLRDIVETNARFTEHGHRIFNSNKASRKNTHKR